MTVQVPDWFVVSVTVLSSSEIKECSLLITIPHPLTFLLSQIMENPAMD